MIEQAHDKASSSLTARKESFDRKANRAGNEKHKISKVSRLIQSCVLVLLGMLYSCAFPGVDWYILGWIGLAPLAAWAMLVTPQRAFRAGLYWGFGWAISAFFWIREIELFLPVPLALYLALYPALWAWAIPYFKKQIFIPNNVQLQGYEAIQSYENPSVWKDIIFCLILACWWCILEWTRSWLMTGFPWNFVAVTQWKNSPLIQIAEYTGTYGVSFIVVFMNLSLVMAGHTIRRSVRQSRYFRPVAFLVSCLLIACCFSFGVYSLKMNQMPKKGTSFRCLVVQADIPQSRAATIEQVNYAMSQHYTLTNDALKEISDASRENFAQLVEGNELNQAEVNFSGKPDLVVWPETGIPISYHMRHPLGSEYRRMVYNLTKRYSTKFFLGTLDYLPGSDQSAISYNAAFLLDQYAAVKSKYYKKHLVPFGEFVPFADQMPWLVDMIGMGRGLIPGESSEPVELKSGIRAGVSICFEDAFPYISRDQVLRGANLLLTITNDAWYPKSDEPVQHLANSIFRAVEMRRTVIRSGNNSASCVISPAGIVIDSVLKSEDGDLLLKSKGQGTAVFSVVVEDKPRLSFYARYGDLFIGCCLILVGFAFVLSIIKWKRKKSDVIKAFEDC